MHHVNTVRPAFQKLMPLRVLALAALVVLLAMPGRASGQVSPPPVRRPNIVFILADDLGWRDLACFGSTFYETPNLDHLARQGMRFTNAYAACNVCSPTRASIMTGQYPARLHLTDWLPGRPDSPAQKMLRPAILQHLPKDQVTLAAALHEGGYTTGFMGKWHLGPAEFFPEKFGFDLNIAGCSFGQPPSYFSPYRIPTIADGPPGEYLTDRLGAEAAKFIHTNKDRPFFLYLAQYAVHNPQQAKNPIIDRYRAKTLASPSAAPEMKLDLGHQVRQVQNRPVYAAMIQSLDESIGQVMQALIDAGVDQNTIIIFTSDNGGLSTSEGLPTSNVPLRMGKGWNYEGGIREPLIIRWPGVAKAGAVCDHPMISTDYYPTLLDAAALPARPKQHLDGVSIVPLLKGNTIPDRPLFWHYPHYSNQGGGPSGAIRVGQYKLIETYEDNRAELYDLSADPGETHDLSPEMPERAAGILGRLHDWLKSVNAQMPTPNPNYAGPTPGPQTSTQTLLLDD